MQYRTRRFDNVAAWYRLTGFLSTRFYKIDKTTINQTTCLGLFCIECVKKLQEE